MEPNNNDPYYNSGNDEATSPAPVEPTFNPNTSQPVVTEPTPQVVLPAYAPPTEPKPKNGWLTTTAYLPEFFIMLVALGSVLSAISSLIATGLGLDKLPPTDPATVDMWSGVGSYVFIISLSSLIVFLPIFVFLYLRTQGSEKQAPEVVTHRWRKGFLGGFIVIEALGVIWSLITLFSTLLAQVIKVDVPFVGSVSSTVPVWKTIVSTLVSVALTSFVIWVVSRQYSRVGKGN